MAPIPNRHDVSATLMTLDLSSHSINKILPSPPSAQYEPLTDTPVLKSQDAFNAEAAAMAVSCDTLITNLIAESNVTTTACPCESSSTSQQETEVVSECYWDMPYTPEVEKTVDDVQEEQEEDILSVSDIQRLLVTDAYKRSRSEERGDETISALHVQENDVSHPRNSYWDWTSDEETKDQQRVKVIQEILQHEKIRQILSTETMIRNETQMVDVTSFAPQETHMHYSADHSDTYWMWEVQTEEDDVVVAPHVDDPTHPMQSYWDFPSKAITAEERKKEVCSRIMEEEKIRRVLSCADNSRFQPKLQQDGCDTTYVYATHVNDNDGSLEVHQYWNFPSVVDERCLEEAECENVLSADRIVQGLVTSSTTTKPSLDAEVSSGNSSPSQPSYWDW